MKQVEYRTMRLDQLRPSEHNPRVISPGARDGLRRSLDRWGLVQPIVWNEQTGRVVGGHQRLELLTERGVEMAHVAVVMLDEADERALNVALNSDTIAGDFTEDLDVVLEGIQQDLPELYSELSLDELLEPPGCPTLAPKDFPGAVLCQRTFMLSHDQEKLIDRAMERVAALDVVVQDPRNPNEHSSELSTVCLLFLELADRHGL